jgi:hypothetical protein
MSYFSQNFVFFFSPSNLLLLFSVTKSNTDFLHGFIFFHHMLLYNILFRTSVLTTHYFHGMFHNSGPHQSPQMGHHDCHKCTFSHLKLICTEISHEQLYPFIFPVTLQRIHSWHSTPFFLIYLYP